MTTFIDNHAEQALQRLSSQFKGGARWKQLLEGLLGLDEEYPEAGGVQEIESAGRDLLRDRKLVLSEEHGAYGKQLDDIGALVGRPRRLNENDATYRDNLRVRIAINTVSGSPGEVIEVFKSLIGGEETRFYEWPPANVGLWGVGTSPVDNFAELMQSMMPAGVQLSLFLPLSSGDEGDDRPFAFAELPLPGTLKVENGVTGSGKLLLSSDGGTPDDSLKVQPPSIPDAAGEPFWEGVEPEGPAPEKHEYYLIDPEFTPGVILSIHRFTGA